MSARSFFSRGVAERVRAVLADRRARLLLAFDLDGTLAPLVSRPGLARVPAARLALLGRAAAAPNVRVALLSARRLRDLRRLAPVRGVLRAGLYGLEGPVAPLTPAGRRRARRAVAALLPRLAPLAARYRGAWIEAKGMTVAVHDLAASPGSRLALRTALARIAPRARRAGLAVAHGRCVTEFLPRGVDKGRALRAIRRRGGADVVFFFGDSPGDEPAFAALGPGDFAVRVGAGPTRATHRVRGPGEVTRFLRAVIALRSGPARKRR